MAGDNELGTEGWNSCGKDESLGKKKKEGIVQTVQFHKLFSFADSLDVVMMIFGTVGAITNGLCMPLTTIFFGELTDSFGGNQSNKELVSAVTKISLKFLYLGIGAGVGGFLQVACWMVAGERQAARVRNLYLEAMMKQDVTFFDKEAISGEIVGRISGDTVFIQEAIGEKVGKFIQLVSSVIGGFVIAFAKGWLLTLILLSFIPLLLVCGGAMSIVISKTASQSQNAYSTATRVVDQTIGSIRTVASFSGEKQALASYNKSIVTAYNVGLKESLAVGLSFGIATFLLFSMFSLAVWIGPDMIQSKGYTGGDVMNIISSMLLGSTSLGHVSPCLTAFSAGQAAAFKMFKIIARKPEMDVYGIRGKKLDPLNGDIELRDIHFSYPTRPNEQIFRGFSLSVPSGTTTALVGQSGSGKSTVISLIERFYDPHAGEVLIDNINLKEFRLGWIRSKIGLVSQEPVLFTCSIMDNIAYGKKGATINEIRKAADLANASTFIDKLPQGLYTMVGEYGTQLSGGQKQRVAIARAVLKNPRILLLDEATSALDAESEMIVQEALDRVMANTTTIIISHRLNTIRNADMIAVVHQGTIVEKGSHSELLKDPTGPYSQLIQSQEWNKVSVERSEVMGEFSRRSSQKSSSFEHYSSHISSAQESSCRSASGTSFKEENTVFEQEEKPKKVSISRLACLNKPEIPDLLVGSLAAIVNGTIMPIFGLLMSEMIHLFFEPPNKRKEDSKFWAVIFVLLGITTLVVFPARTYFFSVAGGNLIKRIRSMCFEKVIHMEMSWFDEPVNSSGAIGARLSTDATMVRALVGDALAEVVQGCATAIAGLAIAFTASWQLSFIFLAMLPLMGLNGFLQMKFTKGFSADAKMMYEEASQVAKDAVGSIRTVASFCAEEQVMELYKRKCEGPMKSGMKLGLASGIGFGASFGLLFCVYAAIFYAGARLVEDGKATFTDVFRVFFALTMASLEITQSSSFSSNSTKAKIAAASIFAILDRKSNIDPSDKSGTVLKRVKGDIELRHISFKYPTRPDIKIFHDLSLTIRSGKTVALVGESGSGKSTVIALIQRFYDPDSGFITLDGFNIQKLQLKWLRQQMGLVSQEPILFNDTIRANIAYGKGGEDATEAEILEASKSANAFNFISSLQQGYDTVVGERGVQLSGGQKQRVAIARAMVKSPKIVLLDEATSALDAESERVVQEALDRVTVNRTTVVVAHRLSTVRNADVIAVVKNGVIVEKGRHETLVEIEDGVYASLVGLHSSHL